LCGTRASGSSGQSVEHHIFIYEALTMSNLTLWREIERPFTGFGAWNPLLRQLDDFISDSTPKAAFDYEETADAFVLSFDVPGAEPEQLGVEFHKNELVVKAERKRHGPFQQVVRMPEGVKADGIQANYHNGVLTVSVPKKAEPAPQKITVSTSKPTYLDASAPAAEAASSKSRDLS
jgi:HSP20 family protein